VFEKVVQSNARFNALDKLIVTVHSIRMPIGFGKGLKSKGRPLAVMAHLKRSIIEVKAENNYLAHTLIIAKANLDHDLNYTSYRREYKISPVVKQLLQVTGIDLRHGGGITEIVKFQEYFKDFRIVVFGGLNCADVFFDGQTESKKRINLPYGDFIRNFT
jgi:hypothetical protein